MNKTNEQVMMRNLEKALNSEFIIQMLQRNWEKGKNIPLLGNLIGEVYNHIIINKDGYGFEQYMLQMEKLYAELGTNQITQEQFNQEKSRIISYIIASKLGINTSRNFDEIDI